MPDASTERLARMRAAAKLLCNDLDPRDPDFAARGRAGVKAINQGDRNAPYVAYTVRLDGDQTLCIVPPFNRTDGDRISEATAQAFAAAGPDLHFALDEIERLREENERLERFFNEASLALQNQIRLSNMMLDEHRALYDKYAETCRKLMSASDAMFDLPEAHSV